MENEADLIGERRTAAGAIGGELCLMQLDQNLGLAARAIQAEVDPLGRQSLELRNRRDGYARRRYRAAAR